MYYHSFVPTTGPSSTQNHLDVSLDHPKREESNPTRDATTADDAGNGYHG